LSDEQEMYASFLGCTVKLLLSAFVVETDRKMCLELDSELVLSEIRSEGGQVCVAAKGLENMIFVLF